MEKEKKFILDLKEIKDKKYISVKSLDPLILFVVDFLEENNIEPRFDHIAVAAFKLFPEKFALPLYSEYPDVKRVHDCLFHCTFKTKKWLDGGAKQGYGLNDKGRFILNDFKKKALKMKEMPNGTKEEKFKDVAKRKERTIIEKITKTKAYSFFIQGKISEIDKDYLKEALRCTPEASKKELKDNYLKIHRYASEIRAEKQFLRFLETMKKILEI